MNEQPDPRPQPDRSDVQKVVIDDLSRRWELGKKRYGTGLQIGNGRDMTRDALEEAQDLLIYMTGIRERDVEIVKILDHLLVLHKSCVCTVCGPGDDVCHTVADVRQILDLLGSREVTPG